MKSEAHISWFHRLPQLTLLGRVAVLFLVMIVAYGTTVPVALYVSGPEGTIASAAASAICLVGGVGALVLSDIFRGAQLVLYRVLLGTLLRMGFPLGMSLLVYARGGPLVEAGLAYYVVGFYLVMLAIETLMLVPDTRASHAKARLS